jgi:hypothetical protein
MNFRLPAPGNALAAPPHVCGARQFVQLPARPLPAASRTRSATLDRTSAGASPFAFYLLKAASRFGPGRAASARRCVWAGPWRASEVLRRQLVQHEWASVHRGKGRGTARAPPRAPPGSPRKTNERRQPPKRPPLRAAVEERRPARPSAGPRGAPTSALPPPTAPSEPLPPVAQAVHGLSLGPLAHFNKPSCCMPG